LHMSCPYTSSQNGKAERMIRTTNDTVRTLLFQASLPARFWAEGLHTSTYLLNRLPSAACPAPTPHHALFGIPPRYDHLRIFGCACYPNTTATSSHKLDPRSTLCVFLGYSLDHKGYRCFDLTSRRVLISRHVVFDESIFPFSSTPTTTPVPNPSSIFPTDTVVQPLFSWSPAGTASPRSLPGTCPSSPASAGPASPGAAPTSPDGIDSGTSLPDTAPGGPCWSPCSGAALAPAPAPAPPSQFAAPIRVYQRRAWPPPLVVPSPPGTPTPPP
jgi:hypothetical protein